MKNYFRKYRQMSFEQKTIFITIIGLCFSAATACAKLIIGLFADCDLLSIALYSFALLISKLECVLGVKTEKSDFKTRNILIAVFMFASSAVYIGFTARLFFIERKAEKHGLFYVTMLAFISFAELGFAIAGLIRTKNKGHYYRNIKIINLCIALIAILTTQTALLDFTASANTDIYNAYAGIGVGGLIAVCAIYILLAPKISVIDREHNAFVLKDGDKNRLVDLSKSETEIMLGKSAVYGSYLYRANVNGCFIEGDIVRGTSLWKRMHIICKILCCILSEILIFVWFIGRFIFFLRSINIPKRLEIIMSGNGFEKVI